MESTVLGSVIALLVFVGILIIVKTAINIVFSSSNNGSQDMPNQDVSEQGENESKYLPEEQAKLLIKISPEGSYPLRLIKHQDDIWLQERTTGLLVNVDSRQLPLVGIWAVRVRGESYYKAGIRKANLKVGMRVSLLHEPDNKYDPNAIAIIANGDKIGYYNKGKASRLVKVLSSGSVLDSMLLSIAPLKVLSATDEIFAELLDKGPR